MVAQEKLVGLAIGARQKKAKRGPPGHDRKTCEERRVVTGFQEACGSVYRRPGFDDLLPISYEVLPGSEYEGNSLIPALERVREREGVERALHVADRGTFGEANLKDTEDRRLQYIADARQKSPPKDLKERILDLDAYKRVGGVRAQGVPHLSIGHA